MKRSSIIKSYSVVIVQCDNVHKKNCELMEYVNTNTNAYKVVRTDNEPNVATIHAKGEIDERHENSLCLYRVANYLCGACGLKPPYVAEKAKDIYVRQK